MSEESYKYKREKLIRTANGTGEPVANEFDEFELEALEGLKMLEKKDAQVFTQIDNRIDQVLIARKKRNKTLLYVSLAATLVLIFGLSLVFKNSFLGEEKPGQITLAENSVREDSVLSKQQSLPVENDSNGNKKNISSEGKLNASSEIGIDEVVLEEKREEDNFSKENIQKSVSVNSSNNVQDLEEKKLELANAERAEPDFSSSSMANAGAPSVADNLVIETRKNLSDKKTATFKENEKLKNKTDNRGRSEAAADSTFADFSEVQISANNSTEPIYRGGKPALIAFFKNNFKVQDMTLLTGKTMMISVYVNEKGKVSKYKIIQSVPMCSDCSKEAIRVCGMLPDWIPANDKGKPEGKRVTFSITF